MDVPWLKRNRHMFFYPGSPVELLELKEQGPALGVMLGSTLMSAKYLLCNVPLQLGDGIYTCHFLVMPHAVFEVALGLEFMDTYAARLSTKAYGLPSTGPQLYIPTPRSYCSPAVQRNWPAGCSIYHNKVPGQFSVSSERNSTVAVSPAVLSA
jgi:hypothetical protein